MWVQRSRAAVRDREMEARAFEQSEKRRAVQAGELQLPAAEISRLFGGFIPPHLQTPEMQNELNVLCTFDSAEANTWASAPGGSPYEPLAACRHWNASEQRIDCSIDRPPSHNRAANQGDCSRKTFGRADSPWQKRQVSSSVPSTRYPQMTFVSALIDIGRYNRPRCRYLQYMRPLLRVNVSLLLYLEPWAVRAATAARAHYGLLAETEIRVVESWDEVPFFDKLPRMRRAVDMFYFEHARYGYKNGAVEHQYAEYDWVNHAKVRSN